MDAVEKGVAAKKANEEALMASMAFQSYGPGQAVILPSTDEVRKNIKTVAKGAAIAPFTVAPDLLGITLQGLMGSPYGGPRKKLLSGDPIREAIGIDPEDPWGMAGEMVGNWENAAAKVPALLGKALTALTDPSAVKGGALLAQSLFHGTPHKFSKFELDKIGTGEGAQAYGHGLYFAESPGVAKSYQHQLTPNADVFVDGKKWGEFDAYQVAHEVGIDTVEGNFRVARAHSAMQRVGRHGGVDEAINEIDTIIPGLEKTFPKEVENLLSEKEFLNKARDRLKVGPKQKGHLYEVDIPDETIGKMLDWDADVSDMPKAVQEKLRPFLDDMYPDGQWDVSGNRFYKDFADKIGGREEAASKALNEAGIPGIRFFDGSSRSAAPKIIKEASEYEGRLWGGAYSHTALGRAAKDAPIRKMVANARDSYNKIRVDAGLDKITDWTTRPERLVKDANVGTRNIVVFNPDDISKVKRDGELVYDTGKKGGLLGEKAGRAKKAKPMYHGTPEDFDNFDMSKVNPNDPDDVVNGIWFTSKRGAADSAGRFPWGRPNAKEARVIEAEINLKNPATRKDVSDAATTANNLLYGGADGTLQDLTRQILTDKGFDGFVRQEIKIDKAILKKTGRFDLGDGRYLLDEGKDGVGLYSPSSGGYVTGYLDADDAAKMLDEMEIVVFDESVIESIK